MTYSLYCAADASRHCDRLRLVFLKYLYVVLQYINNLYHSLITFFPSQVINIIHINSTSTDASYLYNYLIPVESLPDLSLSSGHYLIEAWDQGLSERISLIINASHLQSVFPFNHISYLSHIGTVNFLVKYLKENGISNDTLCIKANDEDVTTFLKPFDRSLWIPGNVSAKTICAIRCVWLWRAKRKSPGN